MNSLADICSDRFDQQIAVETDEFFERLLKGGKHVDRSGVERQVLVSERAVDQGKQAN